MLIESFFIKDDLYYNKMNNLTNKKERCECNKNQWYVNVMQHSRTDEVIMN